MNKVFQIGNLTRDPELTETSNGVSVCRFSIAVNRNYADSSGERKTDFFQVVAWRGLAETCGRYLKKGKKVAVSGSLQNRDYEDREGIKRTVTEIIAQDVEFLSSSNGGGDSEERDDRPQTSGSRRPTLQAFDDDGDIPF